MFDGLYILRDNVPFLHPVLVCTITLGGIVLASIGRKLIQLLSPLVRALSRLVHFP